MIPLSPEQNELLADLVKRWKFELENNLQDLEENLPRELQDDMRVGIEHSIEVADNTLDWLSLERLSEQ